MDSFEINKILASILLIALLFIGLGKISNLIFNVEKPKTAGYKVELPENDLVVQTSETKTAVAEEIDIASLLALGDITHGEKFSKNVVHVIL